MTDPAMVAAMARWEDTLDRRLDEGPRWPARMNGSPRATREAPEVPRLDAVAAADLIAQPGPTETIEGLAWAGCVSVVVSESGTGKTFVLLSVAAAVSSAVPWFGRQLVHGSVAYLSFEGDALGIRLRALRDVQGHRLEHVYIIRASDPLSPIVARDGTETRSPGELEMAATLGALVARLAAADRPPIVLVVVDTVRASLAGSEDSSADTSAYLRAMRRLAAIVPTAAIVLVHHAGWQDGDQARKRERGSSAWRGNSDAVFYLEAGPYDDRTGEAELTLTTRKTRDAERPAPLHLIRRRVELADMDRYGRPVTSCVVEADRRTREDREAEQAQASEAATRGADLVTLRVIHDHPEAATSIDRIRVTVGQRRTVTADAIARLIQRGWLTPPERQRLPYTVTATGIEALGGSTL